VQLAAQFLAEVAERLLPEREVNERVFRLLLTILRALKTSGEVTRPLLYFDYWMVRLGGFLPGLDACSACGSSLEEDGGYYSRGSETLLCRQCKPPGSQRVSTAALAMARIACHAPLDKWLAEKVLPGCREARHFLEEMIESHTEKKLITRQMMEEEV
jgi:DNA repair protein RecO